MLRACTRSLRTLMNDVPIRHQCCTVSYFSVRSLRVLPNTRALAIRTRKTTWTISRPSLPHAGFSTLSEEEIRRKMEQFNDLFVTAREEMEYAGESKDTTYFDEEAAAAKEAVEEAVGLFESVLDEVSQEKRGEIMRTSGLRVEQLKAELDELLASDDH